MMALILPPALRARIADDARAAYPRECCGLIEGTRDGETVRATVLHPARNLAGGTDRFEIAPNDHFAALRAARAAGRAIVGCYHSHPDGRAEPSAHDAAGAAERGFVWVIAAPSQVSEAPLAAYVFEGEAFLAVSLVA